MYPAGRATGTLEDFKAFAQALLQKKTLFKRSETWDTLYTATSNYPDSDLPTNAHGFWSDLYQDQVILGHGGNTAGFSSSLTLDLKSGIAAVILTNQLGEKNYVEKIPELVYGQKKDVPNKKKKIDFTGAFIKSVRENLSSAQFLITLKYLTGKLPKNSAVSSYGG